MKFNRPRARSCTWVQAIPSTNTCRAENGLKAARRRRTWECWLTKCSTWAAMCQKGQPCPGCIQSTVASREREGIFPIYSTLVKPYLDCCIQIWSPKDKNMGLLEWIKSRYTKMIVGLEHLSCEDKLKDCGGSAQWRESSRDTFQDPSSTWKGPTRELESARVYSDSDVFWQQ